LNAVLIGSGVRALSGKLRFQVCTSITRKLVISPIQEVHKGILPVESIWALEFYDVDARDVSENGEISGEFFARLLGMNIFYINTIPVGGSLWSGEIDGKRRHDWWLGWF